jgi:threonyl-tRNA synthetase
MLVVGDREQQAGEVSVRRHRKGDKGSVPLPEFAARLREQAENRTIG